MSWRSRIERRSGPRAARRGTIGRVAFAVVAAALLPGSRALDADDSWPQFRGPNGSARSTADARLPDRLGPGDNVIWKVPLPPGHSSPVVVGKRIYLTAVRDEQLSTIALDRDTGELAWEQVAPHRGLEQIHRVGSHAQATPACDGERVVSFFGSCGLFCYDIDGRLLWQRPLGPFNNDFGAAISPILVDDLVILCQDHDTDSFLMALDKRTGETVWMTDRSEFPRNYCTPVIADVEGRRQIVVAGTLRVVGYDLASGREQWTVRGIARAACCSPGIADDDTIFIASFAGGGEPGDRISLPPFDDAAPQLDEDGNATLELRELPEDHPLHPRFSQADRDKSGSLTRDEYEYFRTLFDKSRNVVVAIRPGGEGDVTQTRVAWEFSRYVPFIASPLYAGGHVFLVKDGGILTTLDAASGAPARTARLDAGGAYYSSPVAGDGKVYLVNERGQATVVSADGNWKVISTAEFGEDVYATPAIAGSRIYLRTAGHLYCFGSES